MKIKCPLCKKEYDFKDYGELDDNHLYAYHGWEGGLTPEYARLIFKIYEKIEELDNKHVLAGSYNDFEYSYALEILNSLLEDKK